MSLFLLLLVGFVLGGVLNVQEYTYLDNVLNDLKCRTNNGCPLKNLTMGDDWTDTAIMNVTGGSLFSLTLHANHLTGMMSTWLGKLTHLTSLTIAAQGLGAANPQANIIPTQLALLTDLVAINVHAARLVGTVPQNFATALSKLTALKIGGNQLTGSVPFFPRDARGNCLDFANSPNCDVPNGGKCMCNASWAICPNGTPTNAPSSLTSVLTTTTKAIATTKTSSASASTSTTKRVMTPTATATAKATSTGAATATNTDDTTSLSDSESNTNTDTSDTSSSSSSSSPSSSEESVSGSSAVAAIGETTNSATNHLANLMTLMLVAIVLTTV